MTTKGINQLTDRHREVLDGLLQGSELDEIAAAMGITKRGVQKARERAVEVAGARNIHHLIGLYARYTRRGGL